MMLGRSYPSIDGKTRYVYSPLNGCLSRNISLLLRRFVRKIPHSFYVDKRLQLHTPIYRKYSSHIRSRLLDLIDYLDGSRKAPRAVKVQAKDKLSQEVDGS